MPTNGAPAEDPYTVLSSMFKDKVSYPGQATYKATRYAYFTAQEEELSPSCIVAPTSADEVSKIVKALARSGTKFAVRGGGHTLNAGAANIDGGVTINLRDMNSVSLSADKSLIHVGGGAKWAEVYPHLDGTGVSTSGGRAANVGVGGLSTGGGISFFSAREGLVCDNIDNYEIVLANGEVINVNQKLHEDLWIALKGGSGSNFGIITRFDIRTFPQGEFYGGVIVCPISTVDVYLSGYAGLLENFDPYAAIILSISWNEVRKDFSIFCNLEYTKPEENPSTLQPFLNAQPQYLNTMRISTLTDISVEVSKYGRAGSRNQFATTTFGGGLPTLQKVHSIWNASIASISDIKGINWAISIQPFPPAFSSETAALGGNSLGLEPSDGPLTLFLISYSWANVAEDAKATAAAQKLIADIDAATKEAGSYNKFKYLNYAASWQRPIATYGQENIRNLKAVSAKYDPEGVFQHLCPGGFKLSDT